MTAVAFFLFLSTFAHETVGSQPPHQRGVCCRTPPLVKEVVSQSSGACLLEDLKALKCDVKVSGVEGNMGCHVQSTSGQWIGELSM